jgi:hypothetical protein
MGMIDKPTTRPSEPEFLIQWREWDKAGPPKCCHTCEHYGVDGLCVEFFMTPPEEFAASMDACDKWEREIPF